MRATMQKLAVGTACLAAFLLLWALPARAAQQFQGVCAVVKIEILQELTLERIGFLATLEITNNEVDASITDFSAELTFENPKLSTEDQAHDASDLFFVQPPKLSGIDAIDGTGVIRPGQTARIEWFVIPKIAAGGTTPDGVPYRVGARLAGSLNGEPIPPELLEVIPDTITVKPEPQLEITYFQPRDVQGDDPSTPDVVETPIPFTLGVLVKNAGYGPARKVRVVSQQPRIVENRQRLLLVAQLIGARVDDDPLDRASLTIELGDIQPGQCRKGAWDMITSLSGEFVEFQASYTHASELGGRETSIINSLDAYFIAHEVLNDQPGRDELLDFLADTVPDPGNIPDFMYESDCNVVPVNRLTDVEVVSFDGRQAVVRVTADFENWVYVRLDDPAQARYPIARVERSDGKVLSRHNVWANVRYRRSDNARLAYLNIFDFVGLGTYEYTVYYQPPESDTAPPVTELYFAGPVERAGGVAYITPDTQLYFIAEDESTVATYYRLDAGPDFRPAYPFRITDPGTHTVTFYSQDVFGNREPDRTATLMVAGGPPRIAGFSADTDRIVFAGDALTVRSTEMGITFEPEGEGGALTAEAQVYRGAYGWVTVAGVPASPTPATDAVLTLGGENVDFYRYRVGGGGWSTERSVSEPLALTGLSGMVSVSVLGRSAHGEYPAEDQAVTVSWTVDPGAPPFVTQGVPATPTRSRNADLRFTGVAYYCYRVDGGGYFPAAESDVIALERLGEGAHTMEVLPRSGALEACPGDEPGQAVRWEVAPQYGWQFPVSERIRQVDLGEVGPGSVSFVWDGRDDGGAVVPPGWYTVQVWVRDALGQATSALHLVEVGEMLPDGAALAGGGLQTRPDAAGRWVVWQEQRSDGNWDVRAMRLTAEPSAPVWVTSDTRDQERPRTDGRWVVWQDRGPDGSWDVRAWELGSPDPPVAVTDTPGVDETRPDVDWPWVVYQRRPAGDPDATWQVWAHNLITGDAGLVDPTRQDQKDPAVHAGRVVWQDLRDVGNGEIYLMDLEEGTSSVRLTHDPGGQFHPDISGDWVVWEDNRNLQVDLYGYDLLRGIEVRLTNTPFDEVSPRLRNEWLLYAEDSAGETRNNLRILNLWNRANVQLTNASSDKATPAMASGWVVWADDRSGLWQVMGARLPDLQPVFDNRNLVPVTQDMVGLQGDAFSLLERWHAEAGVTEITRYTALLPEPVAETAIWGSGGPVGVNFGLQPGSFLWVGFDRGQILDLGAGACGRMDLQAGINVVGYTCFPQDYTAYRLIRELGTDRVTAVRVLEAATGRWRAASVHNGQLVGEDFPVPRVAVVMLDMAQDVTAWQPGGTP